MFFKRKTTNKKQLDLAISRPVIKDRNFHKGGRSFYFFDFDDNIAILGTPTFLFHKDTGEEIVISSGEFAQINPLIGKSGPYKDYAIDFNDEVGSFRKFRDRDFTALHRFAGKKQYFVEDLMSALGCPEQSWKGPSWSCFYHAVHNSRPVSLITARGHHPETIKKGIQRFVKDGYLNKLPNYLSVYPVNHPKTKKMLAGDNVKSVSELKRLAIRKSVEKAFECYGMSPYHRFGMSDDDPKNIEMILAEMKLLKQDYPENSFFVIETHNGQFIKNEVYVDHNESAPYSLPQQLDLQLNQKLNSSKS